MGWASGSAIAEGAHGRTADGGSTWVGTPATRERAPYGSACSAPSSAATASSTPRPRTYSDGWTRTKGRQGLREAGARDVSMG